MRLDRLYLDYNATSPLSKSVTDWLKSGEVIFANPSSQHTNGKAARKLINESRAQIYSTFGKNEKTTKLFFHSGATESFMTFAYSFSEMARLQGKELLICYSRIDHPAVVNLNERYFGPHVKFTELQRTTDLAYDDEVNFTYLQDKKADNPQLIILYHHLWVHNETGLISPLTPLKKFKSIPDLYIHVDAAQAIGKIADWNKLEVGDVWTFSGHKFGAMKGIGFTLMDASIPFYPLFAGGGQQQGLRSGTENPQGIKSLALALNDVMKIDVKCMAFLRATFESRLKHELKELGDVIGLGKSKASNTIYFYFNELSSDISLAMFDLRGLEISAGSACSSGTAQESMVLKQAGLLSVAKNGLRISLPLEFNEAYLNGLIERIIPLLGKLRLSLPAQ